MTQDYGGISDTAKAVVASVWPMISAYIDSITGHITLMDAATPFTIADYGSADGANSTELLEMSIDRIRSIKPSIKIRLLYMDIADKAPFERFWKDSRLSRCDSVEVRYVQQSFYESLPETEAPVHLGFSSTAMHWLNTKNSDRGFFKHQKHIQANQLPADERTKYIEKWRDDWASFFRERSRELVKNGALFLANLTDLGDERWPASAGYDYLRDICHELYGEGHISDDEFNAFFIPGYFATPDEMRSFFNDDKIKRCFDLRHCDSLTVPCAYSERVKDRLDNPQTRADLAGRLAHVVRAWSESSVRSGLLPHNENMIEEVYKRLREKFLENPKPLPYQYCMVELRKITCSR